MTDRKDDREGDVSRRDFVALSVAAGFGAATRPASAAPPEIVERDVEVETPDGTCDAAFFHPAKGSQPGVLVWPDSNGLRPAFRELGRRLAGERFSVLVPNHLYRTTRAPAFPEGFNPIQNPADMETYRRALAPFLAPGAAERDGVAFVAFLDAQPQVNRKRKIGVHGYCLGGRYVLTTAAAVPDRVGAGASLHGGFLATDKPDSAHLLAPRIKARLYVAIASDDDQREPEVKATLRAAFAAAKVRAEIELYEKARHGWCVPDSKAAAESPADVERAWGKLVGLYKAAL